MINKSFILNYIKIYFWEFISFIFRFISMFIVIPFLTKDPAIYGIYAICISLGIFLNYADLGFLKATKKFAAEYYAKGDRDEEMKFLGFGIFILLIFTLIITTIFLYLAAYPNMIIDGLNTSDSISTASKLLAILAIFTPVTLLRRLVDMIFSIRLDNFISKRIILIGSIITISSTFYFFGNDKYMIVSYFLFFKIIDFIVVIICIYIAKKKYNYNFLTLFSYIRFNLKVYNKANRLAYSGLYLMLAWVLFYELDQLVIGKFLGAEKVAIYSIALTFPILFRQLFGIFFNPFIERANHLIGINDNEGLEKLILKIIIISAPLALIPTIAISIVVKPFILSWVGIDYVESINMAIFLVLSYSLSFITYPTDIILLSKEKIKDLYVVATIPTVVFWIGVIITSPALGVFSFSLFKFIGMVIIQVVYIPILLKTLNISLKVLISRTIKPLIIPLIFLFLTLSIANSFLPIEKAKVNFLITVSTTTFIILISFFLTYFTSKDIQAISKNTLNSLKNRKNN
jgi:O-antigen/teichoic acid export membrane protein